MEGSVKRATKKEVLSGKKGLRQIRKVFPWVQITMYSSVNQYVYGRS